MDPEKTVIPAKPCYDHLGGKLGSLLLEAFIEKKWLEKNPASERGFIVTEKGAKEFSKLGIDLAKIKSEKPR